MTIARLVSMRYLTPPPMPSENALNAASVPQRDDAALPPQPQRLLAQLDVAAGRKIGQTPRQNPIEPVRVLGTSRPVDPRAGAPRRCRDRASGRRKTPTAGCKTSSTSSDRSAPAAAGSRRARLRHPAMRAARAACRRRPRPRAAAPRRSRERTAAAALGCSSRTVTSDSRKNATMPASGTSSRINPLSISRSCAASSS